MTTVGHGAYRRILRSTSIIGGASVVNVIMGMLRIKAAALLLGPVGVGQIGLLTNLAAAASAVAGLGFGTAGTRQIAEAGGRGDAVALAAARRALAWGTVALALAGAGVFWALRGLLAGHVIADPSLAADVGWLAVVVALTVLGASQTALLNGLRRIGDLARVSVLSALLSTLLGTGALLAWGRDGLMAFIIAAPLASFLVGQLYVGRSGTKDAPATPWFLLAAQWRTLATLGATFMVAGLATTLGQLLVRSLVQRQLGADALGNFQAASTISLTYIGFVLAAMGRDYFPRLTQSIHDPVAVNGMVNEQTELALLLAGPAFLAMIALAPWIIELLYSRSFHDAAEILRWQVLGDVLKVASWPMGFIILAAGDSRAFMITEIIGIGAFALLTWLALPWLGVVATAMAFVGMYAIHLPMMYWLARRRTGFRWAAAVKWQLATLILAVLLTLVIGTRSAMAGSVVGLVLGAGFAVRSMHRIAGHADLTSPMGHLAAFGRRMASRIGSRRE